MTFPWIWKASTFSIFGTHWRQAWFLWSLTPSTLSIFGILYLSMSQYFIKWFSLIFHNIYSQYLIVPSVVCLNIWWTLLLTQLQQPRLYFILGTSPMEHVSIFDKFSFLPQQLKLVILSWQTSAMDTPYHLHGYSILSVEHLHKCLINSAGCSLVDPNAWVMSQPWSAWYICDLLCYCIHLEEIRFIGWCHKENAACHPKLQFCSNENIIICIYQIKFNFEKLLCSLLQSSFSKLNMIW